jgi:hypothetical protein
VGKIQWLTVLKTTLVAELQNLQTAREILPIWTDWGVQDEGVSIHSLGVTFLTTLGYQTDHVAVNEIPAPKQGRYAHVGDRCSVGFGLV